LWGVGWRLLAGDEEVQQIPDQLFVISTVEEFLRGDAAVTNGDDVPRPREDTVRALSSSL
jgi:hypothetical protein